MSSPQRSAAAFLASHGYTHGVRTKGCLITRAATLIGYTRQTIHEWLKQPEFLQYIEKLQAEGDAASSDGLFTLMRGVPEEGIMPNVAACIAWKKMRHPEVWDEQFRRDQAKREFELEKLKLQHEHEVRLLKLRAQLGVPDQSDRPMPAFNYVVLPPSEIPSFEEPTEH